MTGASFVEIDLGGRRLALAGSGVSGDGLCVSSRGVEGWFSTPPAKVDMTEMQTGDGAHAVGEGDVLYSARTVTIHWLAARASRDEAVAAVSALRSAAHRIATVRVADGTSDTFCRGYVEVEVDAGVRGRVMSGTLTVVCPDPRRYSTSVRRAMLLPGSAAPGGLTYSGGGGLVYPLSYGEAGPTAAATLVNGGSSTAFPVITLTGRLYPGSRFDHAGGSLSYGGEVGEAPLVLDSLSRTARAGGVDSSRLLTARAFPEIPPGGSVTLSSSMVGDGWATVEWRDTFI